jgi:hypothetical protein
MRGPFKWKQAGPLEKTRAEGTPAPHGPTNPAFAAPISKWTSLSAGGDHHFLSFPFLSSANQCCVVCRRTASGWKMAGRACLGLGPAFGSFVLQAQQRHGPRLYHHGERLENASLMAKSEAREPYTGLLLGQRIICKPASCASNHQLRPQVY